MEKYIPAYSRGYTRDFFRSPVCPPPAAPEARSCESCGLLALALPPVQEWERIYTGENALPRGTIFASLYLPLGSLNVEPKPEQLERKDW